MLLKNDKKKRNRKEKQEEDKKNLKKKDDKQNCDKPLSWLLYDEDFVMSNFNRF